jgi:hypothetical protein
MKKGALITIFNNQKMFRQRKKEKSSKRGENMLQPLWFIHDHDVVCGLSFTPHNNPPTH